MERKAQYMDSKKTGLTRAGFLKGAAAVAAGGLAAVALAGCSSDEGSSSSDSGGQTAQTDEAAQTEAQTSDSGSSSDHLARIKEAGVVTVATEGAWSPFTYHDESGELVGFDVEVAKGIAERLGVTAEFREGDFDGGLVGVSQGTFDMMANGVDVTPDREETFDFSDPYAYDHAVLVVRADNDDIRSFEDLKGRTTTNSVGSTYAAMGEEYGATVLNVPTLGETMANVINGNADATINANTSVQDYFNTTGTTELKIAATDEDTTEYAIPLAKGSDNDSLREAINSAIADMRQDGTLKSLSEKYFGSDITEG